MNAWIDAHKEEVLQQIGSPPGDLVLYVVLCYRDCATDTVPIAGEPCRTEDQTTAASRLQDDFRLELRFTPPNQNEEDAVRDFVAWLQQIEFSANPSSVSVSEFIEMIRAAAPVLESPPGSPLDYMFDSPPASPLTGIEINQAEACDYLRAAFRIWTTELRPRWRGYARYVVREGDTLASIARGCALPPTRLPMSTGSRIAI